MREPMRCLTIAVVGLALLGWAGVATAAGGNDPIEDTCHAAHPSPPLGSTPSSYYACLDIAARGGNVQALNSMGLIYLDPGGPALLPDRVLTGAGLPPGDRAARARIGVGYLEQAANLGSIGAMRNLAAFYPAHPELAGSAEAAFSRSIEWLKMAESLGSWGAKEDLCNMYDRAHQYADSFRYCKLVVDQLDGTKPLPAEIAAQPGSPAYKLRVHRRPAEQQLGFLYKFGNGVAKDDALASSWADKANADGAEIYKLTVAENAAADARKADAAARKAEADRAAQAAADDKKRREDAENEAVKKRFQATFARRKEIGDEVCWNNGFGDGFVERIAKNKIQIRVRTFNGPDRIIWADYNQVGLCRF